MENSTLKNEKNQWHTVHLKNEKWWCGKHLKKMVSFMESKKGDYGGFANTNK